MLKKFEEFVNERLFNSTVKRAGGNEDRLEDKMDWNLYDMEIVDIGLPYVFAERDFVIDGDTCCFTVEEIKELEPHFQRLGWRMMTENDIRNVISNDDMSGPKDGITLTSSRERGFEMHIRNKNHHDKVRFPISNMSSEKTYWLKHLTNDGMFSYLILYPEGVDKKPNSIKVYDTINPMRRRYVRLIKDKN